MPRYGDAVYDRASWAMANFLEGDPEAVARSLLAPDTLSPEEHRDLIDKWFGDRETPFKAVARFITNPITLVGLALSWRWPAPTMKALSEVVTKVKPFEKYIPATLRKLSGANEIFHGTGIDDALAFVSRESMAYQDKYLVPLGEALEKYAKRTGRGLSAVDQIHAGLVWDIESGGLGTTLKMVGNQVDELNKLLGSGRIPNELGVKGRLMKLDVPAVRTLDSEVDAVRRVAKDVTVAPQYGNIVDAGKKGSGLKRAKGYLRELGISVEMEGEKYLPNHFPHQVVRETREIQESYERMVEAALRPDSIRKAEKLTKQTTGGLAERYNRMIPRVSQLEVLAENGIIPKEFPLQLKELQKVRVAAGRSPLREYDLRFKEVTERYTHGMGRTYVWTVKEAAEYPEGVGHYLMGQTRKLAAQGGQAQRMAHLLADTYIPTALGRGNMEQYMKGMEWNGLREASARLLESETVKRTLGPKLTKRLSDMINADDPVFTWQGVGAKISQYFYSSTLGFNPVSAGVNLLQPLLTTATIMKPRYLLEGQRVAMAGIKRYRSMMRAGLSQTEAIQKTFPEFVEQGLSNTPMYQEFIHGGAAETALSVGGKTSRAMRKLRETSLKGFEATEWFNRVSVFEGAKAQAAAEGLAVAEASKIAAKITRLTQDWSGWLAKPSGLINIWSPLGQFLSFPAKYAAFLGRSAFNAGGAFNPGTLGRALVASTAAYEAGNAAGFDLSRGLMFGALPSPSTYGPFAPLPMVPPMVGVVGSAVMDIAKGELNEFPRSLPLLVPGGVGASRLLPMLAPKASAAIGRPYADYENPMPDGKIPVYNARGSLMGHYTQWQLARKAIGFPSKEMTDEAELLKYVVRQRDVIREYRRAYMKALANNDTVQAERVNDEFKKRFKLGPIQVKRSDLKAIETRRDMTRLESVLQTLPEQTRGLYSSIVSTALANVNTSPSFTGVPSGMFKLAA